MLDDNLAMDCAKLRYIAGLPRGEALLTHALSQPITHKTPLRCGQRNRQDL
jgi:hypothetical protein